MARPLRYVPAHRHSTAANRDRSRFDETEHARTHNTTAHNLASHRHHPARDRSDHESAGTSCAEQCPLGCGAPQADRAQKQIFMQTRAQGRCRRSFPALQIIRRCPQTATMRSRSRPDARWTATATCITAARATLLRFCVALRSVLGWATWDGARQCEAGIGHAGVVARRRGVVSDP